MRTTRAAVAAALVIVLLLPHAASAATGKGVGYAARYLIASQKRTGAIPGVSKMGSTALAVVALQASERGAPAIRRAMAFLARKVSKDAYGEVGPDEIIGLKAKIVLAAVAAGRDPHAFGGKDLVADIEASEEISGRYGTSAVFNQATAMLALEAAGVAPSTQARSWLLAQQCGDGGWAYDKGPGAEDDDHCTDPSDPNDWFSSDTNTTALVVQALEGFGGNAPTVDPFTFFDAARDGTEGWGYSLGSATDSNSTAMVIQAYAVTGKTVPSGAMPALRKFQEVCSGFRYSDDPWVSGPDVESTSYGILGLLRRPLPIAHEPATGSVPVGCPA